MSSSQEADMQQEQHDRDGSQSNREKLYKRFKKLNAPGGPQISQIHSQKNLVQGTRHAEQMVSGNDPRSTVAMKIRSSQPSRSEQTNMMSNNTAYISPTSSMQERMRRVGNFPCQSPMNAKSTSQAQSNILVPGNAADQLPFAKQHSAQANQAAQQHQMQQQSNFYSQSGQDSGGYTGMAGGCSLSHLKDQLSYKRNNSHGRNFGRAACSTSSAQKVFPASNHESYNSNMPIDCGNMYEQNMTTGSQHGGQLQSKDRQQMSTRTLKYELNGNVRGENQNDWPLQQPVALNGRPQQSYPVQHRNTLLGQQQQQQQLSQSSEQSSCHLGGQMMKAKQFVRMGNQTSHTSHSNLQFMNQPLHSSNQARVINQRQHLQPALQQNQTISMQSEMDLNPLNDSHMFHVSNQIKRYAQPGPLNTQGLNQSSFTNTNFCGDSKFEQHVGCENDMTHSDSSLWLNEELDAAQYENRVRQSHFLLQHQTQPGQNSQNSQQRMQQQIKPMQYQSNSYQQQINLNFEQPSRAHQLKGIHQMQHRQQSRNSRSPDQMNQASQHQQWLIAQQKRAGLAGGSIDLHTQDSEFPHNQLQSMLKGQQQQQQNFYDDNLEDLQHQQQHHSHKMLNLDQLNSKMSNIDSCSNFSGMNFNQRQVHHINTYNTVVGNKNALARQNLNQGGVQNQHSQQANLTGRLSHQPSYVGHASDNYNTMRASYQGSLPSHAQFKEQLNFGKILNDKGLDQLHPRRTERSEQVSLAAEKAASHSRERRRSSERNYPLMQTTHLGAHHTTGAKYAYEQNRDRDQHSAADPRQSYQQFERAKCSTRTNPYTNLLNSNYVGSTAPSATMDQLTASQVNSCSQFVPGNMTIGAMTTTMPSHAGGVPHGRGAGGVAQTLDDMHHYRTQDTRKMGQENDDIDTEKLMLEHDPSQQQILSEGQGLNRGKPLTQAEINAATNQASQAYTNQVAQSLLAQVRPGILKLIQSRIDAIVQELSDEGLYDQRTIMRVLEHRASQLFPDNFMVNSGLDTDIDQNDGCLIQNMDFPQGDHPNGIISQAQMTNPALFTSHANLSNNEIPMDRSIYSDTMLTHTIDQLGMSQGLQPRNPNHTLNFLKTLKEQSLETSDNFRSDQLSTQAHNIRPLDAHQCNSAQLFTKNQLLQQQQQQQAFNGTAAMGNRLNTTEKIINAMSNPSRRNSNQNKLDGCQQELLNHMQKEMDRNDQVDTDNHDNCQIINQQEKTDRTEACRGNQAEEAKEAYSEEVVMQPGKVDGREEEACNDNGNQNLNTDRLMNVIHVNNVSKDQHKGRNFNSRKPQKSDDFKITFAYQSKKSSMDLDQASSSLGGHRPQNSSSMNQPTNNLQIQDQNMISFNPNDNQVHSPVLSNKQIMENIRSFTNQKRQRGPSQNRCQGEEMMIECQDDDNLDSAQLLQHAQASWPEQQQQQQQNRDLVVNDCGEEQQNPTTNILQLTASDIAKLYFQTTGNTVASHPSAQQHPKQQFSNYQQQSADHHLLAAAAQQRLIQQSAVEGFNSVNREQLNNSFQFQQRQNLSNQNKQQYYHPLDNQHQSPTNGFPAALNQQRVGNTLIYQKTVANDFESERAIQQRLHMTQNSDLIDHIGQQFNIMEQNQQNQFAAEPHIGMAFSTGNTQNHQNYNSIADLTQTNTDVQHGYTNNSLYQTQHAVQQVQQPDSNRIQVVQTGNQAPVEQVEEGMHGRKGTFGANESASRRLSSTSISNTDLQAKNGLAWGSFYDVRAEGSIINIKHNQATDPETNAQVNSSSKGKTLSKKTQAARESKQNQKQSASKKARKSNANSTQGGKSRSRSRKATSKASRKQHQIRSQRPPVQKQTPRSVSNKRNLGVHQSGTLGIKMGNLMTLKSKRRVDQIISKTPRSHSTQNNQRKKTPLKIDRHRSECRRFTQPSNYQVSPASLRMHNMRETEKHRNRLMTESKSLTCKSSKGTFKLEKDLLRSLNGMRKENFEAKRDLKALYDHKIDKLRDDLLEQKRESENIFREKLKFQNHTTQLHKKRAENYKSTADELAQVADAQRKKNQQLITELQNQQASRPRKSSCGHYSRSISNKRSSNYFGNSLSFDNHQLKQNRQERYGQSFKPGFSFVSKSLPRNNHNFVKSNINNVSNIGATIQSSTQLTNKQRIVQKAPTRANPYQTAQYPSTQQQHHISSLYESAIATENNTFQRQPAMLGTKNCSQEIGSIGLETAEIQRDFLRSMTRYEQQKDLKLISADLDDRCPATLREESKHGLMDEQKNNTAELQVTIKHNRNYTDQQQNDSHRVQRDSKGNEYDKRLTHEIDFTEDEVQTINPLNSRTTFGIDNIHSTENSARSFEEAGGIVKNHRSLFDASKTLISVKSKETTQERTTPIRSRGQANEEMKQKFVADLQQSGARFKCKNCKTGGRNIQIELPCATCQNSNCHADQTDQKDRTKGGRHMRKNGSDATDASWNSSDLNTEYQDSHRNAQKKKERNAISSKLMKCSSELIANQARLDQIQKILFQPRNRQPRQGAKPERQPNHRKSHHEPQMSFETSSTNQDGQNEHVAATLPQMIDRLRKSRQNLKF